MGLKRILATFALLFGLGASFALWRAEIAQAAPPSFGENVFKPDDRRPVRAVRAPSKWIGKLVGPGGGGCTAGLVGPDLILTAAHCVIDESRNAVQRGSYKFHYGLVGGRAVATSGITRIWYGTTHPKAQRVDDWAILRLKKPLGARYGWMGVKDIDLSQHLDEKNIGVTGYTSRYLRGQTASVVQGCSFKRQMGSGTVLHDCDTLPGNSGAPMYRAEKGKDGIVRYFVVAIHAASHRDAQNDAYIGVDYADGRANIAVPAKQFLPTLEKALARGRTQAAPKAD